MSPRRNEEHRTPQEALFTWGPDWWNNAKVDLSRNMPMYVDGYRKAADLLVAQVENSLGPGGTAARGVFVDCLVFPIGFLYRHHIELRLKQLIGMAQEFLNFGRERPVVPETHRIDQLWYELKPLLERIDAHSTRASAHDVEKVILEFAGVDPESYAFRYPYGRRKQGRKRSLPDVGHINVRHLRDKVGEIADLLEGCEVTISAHFEAEVEYRYEMRKAYDDYYHENYERH